MDFLGIGLPEIIFVLLIAFVLFGPKRIVDVSKTAGQVMRNLSKEASDIRGKLTKELEGDEPGRTGTEDKPSHHVPP